MRSHLTPRPSSADREGLVVAQPPLTPDTVGRLRKPHRRRPGDLSAPATGGLIDASAQPLAVPKLPEGETELITLVRPARAAYRKPPAA
jgi:hypothetical protein